MFEHANKRNTYSAHPVLIIDEKFTTVGPLQKSVTSNCIIPASLLM